MVDAELCVCVTHLERRYFAIHLISLFEKEPILSWACNRLISILCVFKRDKLSNCLDDTYVCFVFCIYFQRWLVVMLQGRDFFVVGRHESASAACCLIPPQYPTSSSYPKRRKRQCASLLVLRIRFRVHFNESWFVPIANLCWIA